jgi:hypothetical protein
VDCGKEEQKDEKLSGTFSGAGPVPEAPVTGAVKENKVVFGWEAEGNSGVIYTVALPQGHD